MLKFPTPITDENFDTFRKYTTHKYRRAKKISVIRNVLYSTAQLVFLFVALILSYGVIITYANGSIVAHLKKLPVVFQYWSQLSNYLFPAKLSNTLVFIRMLGLLYLLPLTVGLAVCLPVILLYHPIVSKLPQDTLGQALELRNRAKKAELFNKKELPMTAAFCSVFYGIAAIGFFISYVLYQAKLPRVGLDVTNSAPRISFALGVFCVGLILAYLLLNFPLRLVVRRLIRVHIPKNFSQTCDGYYQILLGQAAMQSTQAANAAAAPAEPTPQAEA